MSARVFSQDESIAVQAYCLGLHDLIGQLVFQHAVLVNTGLVGKGIITDHRLIDGDGNAGNLRQELTGGVNLFGHDLGADMGEHVLARSERHDHFFHGRIPGAFAYAVNRTFHLAGAVLNGRQGIGYGQTQIVMAVRTPGHISAAGNRFPQILKQSPELMGNGIAGRIRDVNGHGPGSNDLPENLDQKVAVGAGGVFG